MKKKSNTTDLIDTALVDLAIVKRQVKELHTQQQSIQQKLQTLYAKHVLEEDIINEAEWIILLNVSNNGRILSFHLSANTKKDNEFKTLRKYFELTYHYSVELLPGVNLSFDDGDLNIFFDNLQIGLSFLLRYITNIDISPITDRISLLQNNLEAIRLFEQQINNNAVAKKSTKETNKKK